jgi:hypothetical protein
MQLLPFSKAERYVHEIVGAVETGDATPLEIKG